MSTISKVGRLVLPRTALLVCDIQEKFRPAIAHFDAIVSVSSRLIEAARILQMQTIVTEMNPKGLGPTVPELGDLSGIPVFPKMTFSMMVEGVEKALGLGTKIDSVILCGIETHVCVQQTALDLRQRGIDVHCVADAVSSRNMVDRLIAFERMRQSGVYVTTSEAAILGLMSGADHPLFRTVQKFIIPPAPDSGLLSCDDGREKKQ